MESIYLVNQLFCIVSKAFFLI